MNSVRMRLLGGVYIGLMLVCAALGMTLYAYLRYVLQSSFDASLLAKAQLFAETTEQQSSAVFDFEFIELNLPEYRPVQNAEYFQVWNENGDTVRALSKNRMLSVVVVCNTGDACAHREHTSSSVYTHSCAPEGPS